MAAPPMAALARRPAAGDADGGRQIAPAAPPPAARAEREGPLPLEEPDLLLPQRAAHPPAALAPRARAGGRGERLGLRALAAAAEQVPALAALPAHAT